MRNINYWLLQVTFSDFHNFTTFKLKTLHVITQHNNPFGHTYSILGVEFGNDGRDFPEADLDHQAALYLRPQNVADQAVLERASLVSRFPHEACVADEVGLQPAGGGGQIRETGDVAARGADELVQRSGREQLPLSVRRPESRDNKGFFGGRSTHRAILILSVSRI